MAGIDQHLEDGDRKVRCTHEGDAKGLSGYGTFHMVRRIVRDIGLNVVLREN